MLVSVENYTQPQSRKRIALVSSAVTFWGMADDDNWLDSYPVARTDYPLPFNMDLQAKPAYWGIADPKELPGYGLTLPSPANRGRGTRV